MATTWEQGEEGEQENRGEEQRRQKVEDDQDIDEDVMKLQHRGNAEEGSDHRVDIDQPRAPTIRSEARYGNWEARSNAQEDVIAGSSVRESCRSYAAAEEGR